MLLDDEKCEVLEFLKKELKVVENKNGILVFYAVGAKDLIKYLEHPEKCDRWPFDFIFSVESALKKIKMNILSIPFTIIEAQTEEDRVLSKLLSKNDFFCFGTNTFFKGSVDVSNVIQYLERQNVIYDWSSLFLTKVQQETKRVKEFVL